MPHVTSPQMLSALRAAGEATRLRILALLARSEFSVKDLTQILGQSQPRVSRHLKLLADAGLIERFHEGSWAYFRLRETGAEAALIRNFLSLLDPADRPLARDWTRAEAIRAERFEAAQAYFRAHAAEWDRLRALYVAEDEVEDAMREALGEGPFEMLADLGAGTGRSLELFAPKARRCIGVDVNKDMLACARARLDRPGLSHAQLRHGDILDLPLENGAADAAILHQVLHFLDEPGRAIAEAARILKPGGRILIVDFAPHELEFLREEHAHRRLGFEEEQIAEWMRRAGLEPALYRELPPHDVEGGGNLTVAIWLGARRPDRETARDSGRAAA